MEKSVFLKASGILFLIALGVFLFTFYYYHYAKDNGLLGKTYHETAKKPFVTLLFGILGTVLLAASIICLVFGL